MMLGKGSTHFPRMQLEAVSYQRSSEASPKPLKSGQLLADKIFEQEPIHCLNTGVQKEAK